MAISIGSGSSWKGITNLKVGSGGVWKQAQAVWVGVGGFWKKAWDYLTADAIDVDVRDVDSFNQPTSVSFMYSAAGMVWTTIDVDPAVNIGTWLVVGANTDFQIQLTGSGTGTPTGSTLNDWHPGNTGPSWTLAVNGGQSKEFTGTLSIRRTSDQVVVDTAGVYMLAESSF